MKLWDVIVIGGGHAGCEAAVASAKLGCQTALITLNANRIGFMSCNPAVGGLAKGQLVKEIDALGGVMGINTDKAAIQYRRLNASKGPAVRSSRAQCDKAIYAERMQELLAKQENLSIIAGEVTGIEVAGGRILGIRIGGDLLNCRALVVTSGTFLRALMFTGLERTAGGRAGDSSAVYLSESIKSLGFKIGRLKTGTPPRLSRQSIDYSQLLPQPGDENPIPFSFYGESKPFPILPQINCHITYTNIQTHEIISKNTDRSPLFTGAIQGVGPRYCPSIEDKVKRFNNRDRHQIFLEPEGLNTDEVYVNGISTSLPKDVQEKFVHSIIGLERAEFSRYGYAVEYDCIDARQLKATLESKDIKGLFFAGQVNGTSGYEEAAAQGLIAGINAAQTINNGEPFILSRSDAYIGVLIDDLVLKGADEPYRMFTSRAEYRLLLREDNADLRLSEFGWKLGLLCEESYRKFSTKRDAIDRGRMELAGHYFSPSVSTDSWFVAAGFSPLKDRISAEDLLKRPEIHWGKLKELGFVCAEVDPVVREQIEVQVKYAGYIKRDIDLLEGLRRHEGQKIPKNINYDEVFGLSNEIKGRFKVVRPETIGQASRLIGVTPAAVANLMIFLKMREATRAKDRAVL